MGYVIGIIIWLFISVIIANALTGGDSESSTNLSIFIFFVVPIVALVIGVIHNLDNSKNKSKSFRSNEVEINIDGSKYRNKKIKDSIDKVLIARSDIEKKINQGEMIINELKKKRLISRFLVYGFFLSKKYSTKIVEIDDQNKLLIKEKEEISYDLECNDTTEFRAFQKSFNKWLESSKIWPDRTDVQNYNSNERDYLIITSNVEPIVINFPDDYTFYSFPNVILLYDSLGRFIDACDPSCFSISLAGEEHRVEANVPKNTTIIRKEWLHSRVDGSPDKRFNVNYYIYTVKYGRIKFNLCNFTASFLVSSFDNCNDLLTCLKCLRGEKEIQSSDKDYSPENKNLTSIQKRVKESESLYASCTTVDEIISCYLKNTPKDEWFGAIQIEVLRYYMTQKSVLRDVLSLDYGTLKNMIEHKATGNKSRKCNSEPQITKEVSTKEESVLNDNVESRNLAPLQKRIADAVKLYSCCQTVDQIIDCYLKNIPKDEWLKSTQIEVLRYYIMHKSHLKNSVSFNYSMLKNMIEHKVNVEKQKNHSNEHKINIGGSSAIISVTVSGGSPSIEKPITTEDKKSQPTLAEYSLKEVPNVNSKYTSQKITYSNNAIQRLNNTSKYELMKKIFPSSDGDYTYRQEQFYLQAKFMEDFEETYDEAEPFMKYSPTYMDMDLNQLRTYFAWRTRVRKGEISKTSLSYAYIHIYELLNQIGVTSSIDGLERLINFYLLYRKYDKHLDRYVPYWIKDYIVFYDCSLNELEKLPTELQNYNESVLIFNAINADNYINFAELLNGRSSYKITHSRFFQSTYGYMINEALPYVMKELKQYYCGDQINKLIDFIVGKESTFESWEPFRSAVVYNKKKNENRQAEVNGCERYSCSHGNWMRVSRDNYDRRFITSLLRMSEYYLRKYTNYPNQIRLDSDYKSLEFIVDKGIQAYCLDKGLMGAARKTIPNKGSEIVVEKKVPVRVTIDLEKLQGIRNDANEIQEKLLANNANEYEKEVNEESEIPARSIGSSQINHTALDQDNPVLLPIHKEVINALLNEENAIEQVASILNSRGLFLEVVLEEINETLFEFFHDNIIDTNVTPPNIREEYLTELDFFLKGEQK